MRDFLLRPAGLRRGPRAEEIRRPWVLLRDGRVAHCGPEPPEAVPEGTRIVEGGWLIEPLTDAHVHLFLAGSFKEEIRRATVSLPRDEALRRALGLLERYRRSGIAAVRDGGDPGGLALEASVIANRRPDRYAAILPAGEPVYRRGRYGAFLGRGVERASEAVRLLEENRARGATHAKILATGLNSLEEAGRVDGPQFSGPELGEILAGARNMGLPVMIHANGPLEALLPARIDAVTLEHGFWTAEADLARLAAQRVGWTPTLGAWAELANRPGLTHRQRSVVAATDARHRAEVRQGRAMGVRILAGSDAGTPGVEHGSGLVGEIRRLSGAGLPAVEALAASTYGSRLLCEAELGRALGGLETGASAGFVWTEEDPAVAPDVLLRPRGVWLGGEWTDLRGQS